MNLSGRMVGVRQYSTYIVVVFLAAILFFARWTAEANSRTLLPGTHQQVNLATTTSRQPQTDYYNDLLHSNSLTAQRNDLDAILKNPNEYITRIQRSLTEYPHLLRTDPTAARRAVYLSALVRDPSFPPVLAKSLGDSEVLDDCEYACPIVFALAVQAYFGGWQIPGNLDSRLTTVLDLKAEVAGMSRISLKVGSIEDVVQGPQIDKVRKTYDAMTQAQLIRLAGPGTTSEETRSLAAFRLETFVSDSQYRIELYLLAFNDFEDGSGEFKGAIYHSIYRAELARKMGK